MNTKSTINEKYAQHVKTDQNRIFLCAKKVGRNLKIIDRT